MRYSLGERGVQCGGSCIVEVPMGVFRLQMGLCHGLSYLIISCFFACSVQLVGVCLYLFAKVKLVDHVRDVHTAKVKTGAGGKVGLIDNDKQHTS